MNSGYLIHYTIKKHFRSVYLSRVIEIKIQMLTLPLDIFRKKKKVSTVHYSSGGTVLLDGISICPVNDSTPVLESKPVTDNDQTVRFALHGNIALPAAKGCRWILISGTIEARKTEGTFFQIEKCDAVSRLSDFAFDEGVILIAGVVELTTCRYHAHVRITGDLRIRTGDSVEAEALIDAPVRYMPDTTEGCGISTLLSDATVRINDSIALRQGTIRFEVFSTPQAAESIGRHFDVDDELLYQFEDPVTIGNFKVVPIPEKPVTMSVALVQTRQTGLHLHLTVYPAQIRCNFIGGKTILFIHGNHYNEPFTIDTSGTWQASISSNIFLQLIAPEDPSGKPLLESVSPVLGSLSAHGLTASALSLHSKMSKGMLLPESDRPDELPAQELEIVVLSDGNIKCSFQTGGFVPKDPGDANAGHAAPPATAVICRKGLIFIDAGSISPESACTDREDPQVIGGDGRVTRGPFA
jgi:hypothetical protein